jgi:NAD(P)-dependent dehydrogenase (short-subunit alcohol dehydrogenase family)
MVNAAAQVAQDERMPRTWAERVPARVAMVTQGTCGLGAIICQRLADQGALIAAGDVGLREVVNRHGWLDILVIQGSARTLASVELLAQAALGHMAGRGGRIIIVSADAQYPGHVGLDCCPARRCLPALTAELAAHGIDEHWGSRTSLPGDIGLTVNLVTPADYHQSNDEDIARAVCFLASDQAAFITGQVWPADSDQGDW